MKRSICSRRVFAGGLTRAMLAAGIAPRFVRAETLGLGGAVAANNRIATAHIGTGGQGTSLLRNFLNLPECQPAAIVDPFGRRREAAAGLVEKSRGARPECFKDFREALAKPGFDACVIATPDHWHVPVALAAVAAGKDLYLEKPLGLTLRQNRLLAEACAKAGRVFQYGTQQRSQNHIRKGVELVLNGAIGKVQRIEVWAPGGAEGGSLAEIPVPEDLDYDLYIGPAPLRPCTTDRITSAGSWHCSDYAIGFIAGWGAHPLDVAILAVDSDTKGPFTVSASGEFPGPGLFDACKEWDGTFRFADGVALEFRSAAKAREKVAAYRKDWNADGTTFFGSDGWISLSRGGFDASEPELMRGNRAAGPKTIRYAPNYYGAFLASIRSREPSLCPVEDAARSDALSHLTLLALTHKTELIWDPATSSLQAPAGGTEWLDRPGRAPYGLA
jgi:glucose-fructose oxidoreductase